MTTEKQYNYFKRKIAEYEAGNGITQSIANLNLNNNETQTIEVDEKDEEIERLQNEVEEKDEEIERLENEVEILQEQVTLEHIFQKKFQRLVIDVRGSQLTREALRETVKYE